jgi:drug/metabolite transporter (DMT)-like permease
MLLAQRYTPPSHAAILLLLEPVFAAVFAWTAGGEAFAWPCALGGVLIVAAMAVSEVARSAT